MIWKIIDKSKKLRMWPLFELNSSILYMSLRLKDILKDYDNLQEVFWVQEESKNMGAWAYMMPRLMRMMGTSIQYIGRECSASPAVGSLKLHKIELNQILKTAFA